MLAGVRTGSRARRRDDAECLIRCLSDRSVGLPGLGQRYAFGTYAAAMAKTASTFTVTCTLPTPYNVDFDSERAMDSVGTTRKMAAQGRVAPAYAFFWNPRRIADWGQPVGIHPAAWTWNSSAPALVPVQEEVSTRQRAASATYPDAITVSVTY